MKQWSAQVAIENPEDRRQRAFVISYRPASDLCSCQTHASELTARVTLALFGLSVTPCRTRIRLLRILQQARVTLRGLVPTTTVGAPWVDTYDFSIHERGPSASVNFFWFNQHRGKDGEGKPYVSAHKLRWFTDKRFRQAVLHGLNRQGLIDALLFGKGEPLTSIIAPAQGRWHNPNLPRYEYDPERSRALLGESGFKWDRLGNLHDAEGVPVSFELLLVESPYYDKIGVTFVENMKELGIEVKLQRADFATLLSRTDGTFNYDMTILGWGSSSAAYDPSGSKALYLSSGAFHQWHPKQTEPATEWRRGLMSYQYTGTHVGYGETLSHALRQAILAEELPFSMGSLLTHVGLKTNGETSMCQGQVHALEY